MTDKIVQIPVSICDSACIYIIPIQMLPTMFGNMDDLFKGKGEHMKNILYPDETLIM